MFRSVTTISLFVASATALAAPVCLNSNSDPDGDGWGFENNTSCEMSIDNSQTPITVTNGGTLSACLADGNALEAENNRLRAQITALQSGTTQATCEDTAPVGDGWGWDGSTSCRVGSDITTQQPTITPEAQQQNNGDNSNTTPSCEVAAERIRTQINPNASEQYVRQIVGRPDTFTYSGSGAWYSYGISRIGFKAATYINASGVSRYSNYRVDRIIPASNFDCCVWRASLNGGTGESFTALTNRCRAEVN